MVNSDAGIRCSIEQFLSGPTCDDSIFNADGIRDLLTDQYERGIDHWNVILTLAAVHRALDYFVHESPVPPAGLEAVIPAYRMPRVS